MARHDTNRYVRVKPYQFEPPAPNRRADDERVEVEAPTQNRVGNTDWCTCGNCVAMNTNHESQNRVGNTDWCICGNCVAMNTNHESHCCTESEKIWHKVLRYRSLQVEKGGGQPAECITAVPGFQTVCLDPDVLETAYHQYKQEHGQMRASTEEKYRYIGYRQLVRWCFGILGRNIRVPLPSCCVHKIREHFQSEKYRGFQWPELD